MNRTTSYPLVHRELRTARNPLHRPLLVLLSTLSALIVSAIAPFALTAQPTTGEGPRYFGTTGERLPYDTAALKETRDRTLESAGLMERPIDPAVYELGPNDWLTVTIWGSRNQQYEIPVSPDAKILVPTVGEVDVRGLSLAEGTRRVKEAVSRVYRVDASVVLRKMREFKVSVIGAVFQPGTVPANPTTRVSEAIDLAGGATTVADKRNIILLRQNSNGTRSRIEVDLLPYYTLGELSSNPTLEGGDVIQIGGLDPQNVVQVYGAVNAPGEVPWRPGDSISDLIGYAGGFTVDARRDSIEVVSVDDAGEISSRSFHEALQSGEILDDRALEIGDRIIVRAQSGFRQRSQIVLEGEVEQPGVYPIIPGRTRLRSILEASGGFTPEAAIDGAVLVRRPARDQSDPYLQLIAQINPEDRTPEENDYFRRYFQQEQSRGVMSVDFALLLEGDETQNLALQDRDSLFVPARKTYVRVSGKVKNPGNYTWDRTQSFEDYLALAGGYGWKADEGETQIIKGRSGDQIPADDRDKYVIEPGDIVYVPEEQEGDFWEGFATAITIVAQVATIIAVIISVVPDEPAQNSPN